LIHFTVTSFCASTNSAWLDLFITSHVISLFHSWFKLGFFHHHIFFMIFTSSWIHVHVLIMNCFFFSWSETFIKFDSQIASLLFSSILLSCSCHVTSLHFHLIFNPHSNWYTNWVNLLSFDLYFVSYVVSHLFCIKI